MNFRKLLLYNITCDSNALKAINVIAILILVFFNFNELPTLVIVIISIILFINLYLAGRKYYGLITQHIRPKHIRAFFISLFIIFMGYGIYLEFTDCALPNEIASIIPRSKNNKFPQISNESEIFGYIVIDSCNNRDTHQGRYIHFAVYFNGKKETEDILTKTFSNARIEAKRNKFIVHVTHPLSHEDSIDIKTMPKYVEIRVP